MAETPFSPESGASSGGTAPEDGSLGSSLQPSVEGVTVPPAVAAEPGEAPVAHEPVSAEPKPFEPPSAPEPPAAASQPVDVQGFSPAPLEPAEPAVQPPGVSATITVPPLEAGEDAGGGEWDLLVERFSTWWNSGELNRQWQRVRGPLKGVAIVVVVLLALQLYATVVRTVDGIPLVSGLLELTGLIAVLRFSSTRLLRSSDRQEVVAQLRRRWLDFRGRD